MINGYFKKRNSPWIFFLILFSKRADSTLYVQSFSYNIMPTSDSELVLSEHDEVVEVLVKTCEDTTIADENLPFLLGLGQKKKKKKKLRLKTVTKSYSGEYQIISSLNSTHHYLENYFLIVYDSNGPSFSPSTLFTDKTYNVIVSLEYAHIQQGEVVPNITHVWTLGGIELTARPSVKPEGCPLRGESILRLTTKRYLGGQTLTCIVTLEYGGTVRHWTVSKTIYAPVVITGIDYLGDPLKDSIHLTCLIDYHQFPRNVVYTWFVVGSPHTRLSSKQSTLIISREDLSLVDSDFITVGCNVSNAISTDSKLIRIDMKSRLVSTPKATKPAMSRARGRTESHLMWLFMGIGFALFGFVVVQSLFCVSRRRLKTSVQSLINRDFEMNRGRCSEWRLQKETLPNMITLH